MTINDLYSIFIEDFKKQGRKDIEKAIKSTPALVHLRNMAVDWGIDLKNVERWMQSSEYKPQEALAGRFVKEAPAIVEKVEETFGQKLTGELRLSPSMMRFDGFARYDLGHHTVWFGVDHPDANDNYLRVLLCHELSHVYRDHHPRVWAHLRKPLGKVTRDEYLEASTAQEHLASEGLATLFSQVMYPEVGLHVHHYYFPEEFDWCLQNYGAIENALVETLKGDEEVWRFYGDDAVQVGSPSRTQYFWAARVLAGWLPGKFPGASLREAVIKAHGLPASEFDCFIKKTNP